MCKSKVLCMFIHCNCIHVCTVYVLASTCIIMCYGARIWSLIIIHKQAWGTLAVWGIGLGGLCQHNFRHNMIHIA